MARANTMTQNGLREVDNNRGHVHAQQRVTLESEVAEDDDGDLCAHEALEAIEAGTVNGNQYEMPEGPFLASDQHLVQESGEYSTKRKALEIFDSENENELEGTSMNHQSMLSPVPSAEKVSQPSSQVQAEIHPRRDAKRSRSEVHTNGLPRRDNCSADQHHPYEPDGDDQMLFDQYERMPGPFSQAALNMSDPLTPSDNGAASS